MVQGISPNHENAIITGSIARKSRDLNYISQCQVGKSQFQGSSYKFGMRNQGQATKQMVEEVCCRTFGGLYESWKSRKSLNTEKSMITRKAFNRQWIFIECLLYLDIRIEIQFSRGKWYTESIPASPISLSTRNSTSQGTISKVEWTMMAKPTFTVS